ncbi:conserved hypothetical protein [Methylocella tundrae]|jgi:hypothetical protein|uniref:Uncharacterized protein n=1 Tax=Methylocella tundrae TaxID=227605 RepID=A0A8B6M183_METTU|nr:conserved hypothetical protein [Methylocella tundrae]VTZ48606.1 conserved hypothetical protein [Methylocella tundrae]
MLRARLPAAARQAAPRRAKDMPKEADSAIVAVAASAIAAAAKGPGAVEAGSAAVDSGAAIP